MNASNPSKSEWRRSVNDHCKSCIYDPSEPGTWREQVTRCTVMTCSLYPIRPVSENHIVILDAHMVQHERNSALTKDSDDAPAAQTGALHPVRRVRRREGN